MKIIGRYKITEQIPSTSVATAYKAFDQEFDGAVCVKIYPAGYVNDPVLRLQFEREMQLLSLLDDPNVVPVLEIGEVDGKFYVVTPYFAGGSLADRLQKADLSPDEILEIANKLSLCLETVHDIGIYHHAIKPTNILFDSYGEPYLTDFGTTKLHKEISPDTSTVNLIPSNPVYMSPEQILGQDNIDGASDIYSLCVVLFEMLAGHPPYTSNKYVNVATQHIFAPLPDITIDNPVCHPDCQIFVEYGLAKDPGKRFAVPGQIAETLTSIFAGVSADEIQKEIREGKFQFSRLNDNDDESNTNNEFVEIQHKSWYRSRLISLGVTAVFIITIAIYLISGSQLLTSHSLIQPPTSQTSTRETYRTVLDNGADTNITPSSLLSPSPLPENTPSPETIVVIEQTTVTTEPPTHTHIPPTIDPPDSIAPIVGGADKIAFIHANDIWISNLDGSSLERLTDDEKEKSDLHWSDDGRELIYTLEEGGTRHIQVFTVPVVSPSVSPRCKFTEGGRLTRYSSNGDRVATVIEESWKGRLVEVIKVFDLNDCNDPDLIDVFPGSRFEMRGYSGVNDAGRILEYAWDGADLFALHGDVLRGGGDLVIYNMGTANAQTINPIDGNCCYRDLAWSPDGQYLLFSYQDTRYDKPPQLYYVPFGTIGTGQIYQPINLPPYFFADSNARIYPALHPSVASFPTPTPTIIATSTPTPTPTLDVNKAYGGGTTTETQTDPIVIGGADKVAFFRGQDIWIMNVDGSGLQLIYEGAGDTLSDLQWNSDGKSVFYKSGDCYRSVSIESKTIADLGCYTTLNVSGDGTLSAVSAYLLFGDNLERMRASFVPFNLIPFARVNKFSELETLGSCPLIEGDGYRWSNDKKQIAVVVETINNGRKVQAIQVFRLGNCGDEPDMIDTFPSPRFTMRGYSEETSDPIIRDFSWNGETLFAINGNVVDGFGDFLVYNMDTKKADVLDPLKQGCCYRDMRWSPDGSYLLFSTKDITENILVYYAPYDQIQKQANLTPLPFPPGFWNGIDPGNRLFPALHRVQTDQEKSDVSNQKVQSNANGLQIDRIGTLLHSAPVYALGISPDGTELTVGAGDLLKIWDLNSLEAVHEFNLALNRHTESITGAEFSPDGNWLASCSVDNTVRIWKLDFYAPKFNMDGHALPVLTLDYSPDGAAVASGASDGTIILWRTSNGGIYHKLLGHTMPVYGVAYTPDGERLISGAADKTVRIWNVNTGEIIHTLTGHTAPVSGVSASPDNRYAVSASWDATIRIWDIETGQIVRILKSSDAPVSSVAFSPSGNILVAGSENGLISIWEASTFNLIKTVDESQSAVLSLAFSQDGSLLVVGRNDGKASLWELTP